MSGWPTAGLDHRTRNAVWDVIRERSAHGATVLLTTQYLEEADPLADRLVLIGNGSAVAAGTPDQLKDLVGSTVLEARATVSDTEPAVALLAELEQRRPSLDADEQRITVPGIGPEMLPTVLNRFAEARVEVVELGVRRPSLDEVFLALTDTSGGLAPEQQPPTLASQVTRPRSSPPARQGRPIRHTGGDIWAITARNLKRIGRSPQTLALSLGQPILLLLGFRYLLGGAINVPAPTTCSTYSRVCSPLR